MAREHGRVLCRVWRDEDWRYLTPMAQWFYVLLLSQPEMHHTGVLPLRVERWANYSAHVTAGEIGTCLDELADANFIVCDESTGEVLVRSFIRNDGVAKQPNVLKAALRQALEVESPALRFVLAAELRKLGREDANRVADQIEPEAYADPREAQPESSRSPREPLANPSRTLPVEPLSNPSVGVPHERGGKGKGEVLTVDNSPSVDGSVLPRSEARPNRGTRIPADFTVEPDMVTWARKNTPDVDGRTETANFIDYWTAKPGKDGVKLDWVATWRTWMRKAQKDAGQHKSRQAPPSGFLSQTDANIAAFLGATGTEGATILQLTRGDS